MKQTTAIHTNTPRGAHPAVVRAALRSLNAHRFEYDKLDRMDKQIRPLGQTIVYAYDANSRGRVAAQQRGTPQRTPCGCNLIKVTDPMGQVKKYEYDDVNRRRQEDHYLTATATTPVKSISYSYNTLDRLTGYNDGTTIGTYIYDLKQLKQTGQKVNYGSYNLATSTNYNSLGQKTDITYPDGAYYSYTYDNNNQLSTVNFPTGFGSITINSYNWLVPSQITLPDGSVRNQSYDGLLRLKDFSVKDPGQSSVMSYQYNYDLTANIVAKTTEKGSTSYGYDTLDHLTSATYTGTGQTNESYTYDGVDNRVTDSKTAAVTWEYDANNQLSTAGNLSYTYDDNGNTLKQTDTANAANTRNYVYDTDNRLIEVRNGANTLIAAYSYDPFGRRLSKDAGTSKTYYFYNEEGLIAEADATGVLTKSYGYAPGSTFTTNPLWQKSGNAYYTYQNDHLGTPQKLLSQTGAVVWSATYDAFGKATVEAGSSISNNLRFPGQYFDQETGLHYNWNRYYDSMIGRYITSDPIGIDGGLNLYSYANGSPLLTMDFDGLKATGSWIVNPLAHYSGSSNYGASFISPHIDIYGFLMFVRFSATFSGYINIDVRCTEDEECNNTEYEIHTAIPLSYRGKFDWGPNVIAAGVGLRGGPWASLGVTLLLGAIKAGVGINEMYQKYGVYASAALAAVMAHGPDKICQGSMPLISGGGD